MTMTGNDRFAILVLHCMFFSTFLFVCNKVQTENQQNLLYYSYL